MLLLDIDADFMVGEDCADNLEKHSADAQIPLLISGHKLAHSLRSFIERKTKIFLCVDHHEALYHWDRCGVKRAVCIHVDSHHDAWENCYESKPHVGTRGKYVHCGSFVQQAMADGIIEELINVPHLHAYNAYKAEEIENEFTSAYPGRECPVVNSICWRQFLQLKHSLPKADIVTISISPEWLPVRFLHQLEQLCKHLYVRQSVFDAKYQIARKKWMKIHSGSWQGWGRTVESLDFQFPYNKRPKPFPRSIRSHRKRS